MNNNAIALVAPSEWQLLLEMAGTLVQSGFLPQAINTPQKAVTIILAGRSLGIDEWAALNNINVIQGKPTISAQLMLALINRSGLLKDIEIIGDEKQCSVTMLREGRVPHSEVFTMQNATALGFASKDNWKKQSAVMLKWRAVSACARVVFPDVILGFYTPEEMGADVRVTDDGSMEVITPTEHAQQLLNNGDERRLELPAADYEEADVDDNAEERAARDYEAFIEFVWEGTKQHFRDIKHMLNLLNKLYPNGFDGLKEEAVITAINANRAAEGKENKGWWNDAATVKALDDDCRKQYGMPLWDILPSMGAKMGDYASDAALWAAIEDAANEGAFLEAAK